MLIFSETCFFKCYDHMGCLIPTGVCQIVKYANEVVIKGMSVNVFFGLNRKSVDLTDDSHVDRMLESNSFF